MPTPTPAIPPIVIIIVGVAIGMVALGSPGPIPAPDPTPEARTSRELVVATWNVSEGDLVRSKGVGVSTIVAPVRDPAEVRPLLREAAALDLRVILFIRDPEHMESPAPPSLIRPYVEAARDEPALYGYLSTVEPAQHGLRIRELRLRYAAYKRLDPDAVVVASYSQLLTFGGADNPWGEGVADLVWIEWYPVSFALHYRPGAEKLLTSARETIESTTPGIPVWLVAQCHENVPLDRRSPTPAELQRQIDDGRRYLKATGVVFYPWYVANFGSDLSRNPKIQAVVRRLAASAGAPP